MAEETPPAYLRVQTVTVPVGDLDRSLEFYESRLGFRIVVREMPSIPGVRIGLVAPSHGPTILVLAESDPDRRLGTATGVSFLTDNLDARFREWMARGVRFIETPRSAPIGARQATFVDLDDNVFHLIEADQVTRQLEAERQAKTDRAERERRSAQAIEIATQVQAGLFPRARPPLATLDYEGACIQARQVGGDYFDFLDFGGGRLGLVVGDVSGKGLGAALLMANLQAHVRGQFARSADDLPVLLASVNHLFMESAPAASYASLFFGLYDDRSRRLQYVNCGHPPALLLRQGSGIERLNSTSWVLGMFDDWTGHSREVQLGQGDVLVLYSDGVTEAVDERGEEFGIGRLTAALDVPGIPAAAGLLHRVVAEVRRFSQPEQADDVTIVIARCRG